MYWCRTLREPGELMVFVKPLQGVFWLVAGRSKIRESQCDSPDNMRMFLTVGVGGGGLSERPLGIEK
jgi:hypothetical protein